MNYNKYINRYPHRNDEAVCVIRDIIRRRNINHKEFIRLCDKAFVRQNPLLLPTQILGRRKYFLRKVIGGERMTFDNFEFIVCEILGEPLPDNPELISSLKFHNNFKNIDIGTRFGRLVVIQHDDNHDTKYGHWWICLCDCGITVTVIASCLRNGDTRSCGCLNRENTSNRNTTHGLSKTPEYRVWKGIRKRCFNDKTKCYHNYGGRGITICDRWKDNFENFYEDMGPRPEGMSIDRINNDGNYEPGNCRWATAVEQCNNQRKTLKFPDGTPLSIWARANGVSHKVAMRIYRSSSDLQKRTIRKRRK